jgi:hypothetical protein
MGSSKKQNNNKQNNNKQNNNKQNNNKQNNNKQNNNKQNVKEKFDSSPSGIIDMLSVSPTAGDNPVTWQDQLQDYGILFLKYLFLVTILTLNFLGLSVSLNCNADQEMTHRIMSGVFAFFFGFVYLIINYYTFKVLSQGKICKMNRDKLFPFKA